MMCEDRRLSFIAPLTDILEDSEDLFSRNRTFPMTLAGPPATRRPVNTQVNTQIIGRYNRNLRYILTF